MKTNVSRPRFAICVENSEYPVALELRKTYRIIPDKDAEEVGYIRVIDESGEDYLYPAEFFVVIELPRATARALSKSFIINVRNTA